MASSSTPSGQKNQGSPPPGVVYVCFSAEVNPSTTEALLATAAQCVEQGAKEIYLILSTPGGQVMNGMHVYNVLRGLPVKVTTHNSGNVDSIGNAIFLAGDKRYACPHSTFMFHGVGFNMPSGGRLEEKLLRERLQGIQADQKRIGSIIEEHTDLAAEDVESLFLEATTKDAAYAASTGIVHEVRDLNVPDGAPVVSLVFKR